MKYLFLTILAVLLLLSIVRYITMPDATSPVPILYWATDANPARIEQVELFHQWMREQGHVVRDAKGNPLKDKNGQPQTVCELRIDSVNQQQAKKIIQGVSGVGNDLIDMHSANELIYYTDIGFLADITQEAKARGIDTSTTFPSVIDDIARNGRQYSYPCNIGASILWINPRVFEKYQLPIPPETWKVDDFERAGMEFVAATNSLAKRQQVFFMAGLDRRLIYTLYRSRGVSNFNETMTACTLNDPRVVEVLDRVYRWVYVHHLIASPADIQSVHTTNNGYGGVTVQMFINDMAGLFSSGRHGLIQFRQANRAFAQRGEPTLRFKTASLPYYDFPNVFIGARSAAIDAKSPHKSHAMLFLTFLASAQYNMQIVRDGDSLPPRPEYCQTQEYLRPADYPQEWGLHESFYQASQIAIAGDHSPYVLPNIVERVIREEFDQHENRMATASQAVKQIAGKIQDEIELTLKNQPELKKQYLKDQALQKQIDQRRSRGEPVPLAWIKNPFHRQYYRAMGWLEEFPSQQDIQRASRLKSAQAP